MSFIFLIKYEQFQFGGNEGERVASLRLMYTHRRVAGALLKKVLHKRVSAIVAPRGETLPVSGGGHTCASVLEASAALWAGSSLEYST